MKIITISGASGCGKSTLVQFLQNKGFSYIKSYTTRKPRKDDNNNYIHVSIEDFKNLEQENFFLETDVYQDYLYGTPAILDQYSNDDILVLDLTVEGVSSLRTKMKDVKILSLYLYIDFETLIRRLLLRNTNDLDSICKRLYKSKQELTNILDSNNIDLCINMNNINHDKILEMIYALLN